MGLGLGMGVTVTVWGDGLKEFRERANTVVGERLFSALW